MKKIYYVITLLISQCFLSQDSDILNVVTTPDGFYSKPNRVYKEDRKIDGSPHTNGDKFYKIFIKDYSINLQDLRYNAFNDEMEFIVNGELYNTNKIIGLKIDFLLLGKTYETFKYSFDNKEKLSYLVLLVENPKFSLYKREKVELMTGTKGTNGFTKDANDYYERDKDLYLISKNNQFSKFPKKISEASAIFSVNKQELEMFVKNNRINLSKESDMIRFINFVNSIN